MADMKGLKIRVTGGPPTDAIKALGASPVMVPQNDVYENLQKGVIDGVTNPWEAILGFRQYEVLKYYTYIPMWITYFTVAMNHDVWNNLPADIQQAIESKSSEWGSKYHGYNMFDRAKDEARSLIQQGGHEMVEYTLPPQEVEKWAATIGQPIWDQWVEENEMKSPDATEILSRTQELIKTYQP
jgi:TRAP-type C4-dicarboxylate transport system substrate-binding protein